MRCRWTRPAPAAANRGDLRVTWFWPGNSLEGNRQLRPYIAASARCAGPQPGGRGSDELRAPDLCAMCRTGGRRPVPRVPGGPGSRPPPPFRGGPAVDHRRHPGPGPRALAHRRVAPLALAGDHGPGGNVGDANGGVGGVDPLTAGAAGAEHVAPELVVIDVDVVGLLHHRHHVYPGERGLAGALVVVLGDADHPVRAVL